MLALITVGIIPVFISVSKIYMGQMRRLTREVRSSDSKVQSVLQETIQHRMLIKTLEGDDAMVGRLETTQSELRTRWCGARPSRCSATSSSTSGLPGLPRGLLVGRRAHGPAYADFRWHDGVSAAGQPHTGRRATSPSWRLPCLGVHRRRTTHGLEENPLEELGAPIYWRRPAASGSAR